MALKLLPYPSVLGAIKYIYAGLALVLITAIVRAILTSSKREIAYGTIHGVTALAMVIWPVMLFGSIFMFDSPIKNFVDGIARMTTLLLIVIYPIFYFKASKRGKLALAGGDSLLGIARAFILPYITIGWLVLIFTIGPSLQK